jgi:predicted flap endonuclease-1-like 5' DNA nuclease/uncharacterized membrane protein YeaQ/YmgE (transglycosylase-associated protein family)
MSDRNQGIFSCMGICWIAGALLGIVAFLILTARMGMGWLLALIIGIVVLVAVALILRMLFCGNVGAVSAPAAGPAPKPAAAPKPAEDAAAKAAAEAAAQAKAEADARAKAEAEEKARAEASRAKAEADAKAAAEAKTAADAAAAGAAATPDYDADGVREGTEEGTRPAALDGPRGGKADNLKEIKGIGPKLEILCNQLGFYHFDQIAGWSADEIAWVNANLTGFKGRVTRDNWVEQAKILAAGGETEFSKRVEDGDVY